MKIFPFSIVFSCQLIELPFYKQCLNHHRVKINVNKTIESIVIIFRKTFRTIVFKNRNTSMQILHHYHHPSMANTHLLICTSCDCASCKTFRTIVFIPRNFIISEADKTSISPSYQGLLHIDCAPLQRSYSPSSKTLIPLFSYHSTLSS